ncbi:MAG TPA: ABC transporter substrate-binding protein [Solirubrobacteraceae bacterium]|nr:ABC transporter substrate-binding protein [Solirubrobacteraceae bacterium]
MESARRTLDELREDRTELENHHIDELLAGSLSRRQFLRRASVIGMSAPLAGAIVAACGGANSSGGSSASTAASGGKPTQGGTLRLAMLAPGARINPLTTNDTGDIMMTQTGEFLVFDSNLHLRLQPMLATSWSHNGDGTVWTFKLRKGVKFSNGQPMTADDVVWTLQQQSDPKNAANALSAFSGVLKPEGVVKVDTYTVAFHLESANGNFPYLVSSDNYNTIIVPKGTDFDKWQNTFIGTGAFTLKSYQANFGASFTRNPHWWGGKAYLDGSQFSFYGSAEPQVVALQGGQVDVIVQFAAAGGQALLHNPDFKVLNYKASVHREFSMRCDQAPFNDARVRRAVALSLDRPAMLKALLNGYGTIGNDNPFAPLFPSRNPSVPQRTQNLPEAKKLMAQAGHARGFSAPLYTEQNQEIPLLAQAIKGYAAKIGVDLNLKVESQDQYFGKSTFGQSDWLDGTTSLVDYGDRGVPNVFLGPPLESGGAWNAAHFNNKTYDKLAKQYVAAVDLQAQRRIAGEIEKLLLLQTPIVIPYFLDGLTVSTQKVFGLNPTAIPQLYIDRAYMTKA